jgi:aminotransferase
MSKRTEKLRLSIIKQIELKASGYPDVVSLAQGIPSFDTPACIKRRVENALNRGVVAKYSLSPGLPELRELIEQSLSDEGMYYDWKKEIIVTAGSIEAITATIFALTDPGDEVLIPEPTYTSYREVITLAGCTPVYVPLNEDEGWSFDIRSYEKAITEKTRIIFYCNPNNPTGTIYSREQLISLAELAQKYDLYLISDEVYKDFIYDEQKTNKGFFSLSQLPKLRNRVVRIFSFSKAYAMTGWRVGYLHTDESLALEILKVHDSLVTCAPVISQYAAMGALEMARKDLEFFISQFDKRRKLIFDHLDRLKDFFSYVRTNSSYYVFPRITADPFIASTGSSNSDLPIDSWKFALNLLDKAQVAVVPGMAFGPSGESHIRLSFGRSEEDIKKCFDRMESLFLK